MTSSDEVILAKRQLRAGIGEKRQAFIRLKGRVALAEVVRRTFEHFMENIGFDGHEAMAGYWPMAQEFDSRSFLFKAVDHGVAVSLPVVAKRDAPLQFRPWTPQSRMQRVEFGISVPSEEQPAPTPSLILAPLISFDDEGYRIGYGGGYYDRTLAELRTAEPQPLVVGLAFEMQHVPKLPRDHFDQRLDWVVTEEGARNFMTES